ncbi:hypothetical protein PR048_010069 [Dryococelus australis]|uniref:Reverse transcriptase domain-containing protein n=1 Tax=Dryococelus australis TaxID=614101 RepID=A0ABQ9I2R8_9NEOP|nr:hypothetical protein PR048_010069 [Dryococelus australis]
MAAAYWKIIYSFLQNRTFKVTIDGALSSKRGITEVLSPVLYALYTRDIPTHIGTGFTLYADDTAIYAKDRKATFAKAILRIMYKKLEEYWRQWAIKVNPSKSALLICNYNKRDNKPIHLYDKLLQEVKHTRYSGIQVDNKLTWYQHFHNTVNAPLGNFVKIYPLLKFKKRPTKTKLMLYKMITRPAMLNGAEVWGKAAKLHIHSLQVVQNKILRVILNDPITRRIEDLHETVDVNMIKYGIQQKIRNFYNKAATLPSPIVRKVGRYNRSNRCTLTI